MWFAQFLMLGSTLPILKWIWYALAFVATANYEMVVYRIGAHLLHGSMGEKNSEVYVQ